MMETHPNDKTMWRLDDICMEYNSWDKTDAEIRAAGYATYLMHAARLNHLLTSLNKNPSNKFKVVIDKFTLDDSKTIKTLYNLLIKWNSEKENQEYNNKSTINSVTTKSNKNNNNNKNKNKNSTKEIKVCEYHPNSTSHTTTECRNNKENSKDDKSKITNNKNNKRKNTNNNEDTNNKKSSSSNNNRHCENCAKHFPDIAHTHDTPFCRKPGGVQNNSKNNPNKNNSNNNKNIMLSPDISNAINTSINSAVSELKGYLNKLSKGEEV
jgi:ATP-dependent Clp protease ATP-binding subunit ClpA